MAGNPHHDRVACYLDATILSSDESGTQTIESLLMNNARATLALAYEQRTANLIAMETLLQRGGADIDVTDIQERLGLA